MGDDGMIVFVLRERSMLKRFDRSCEMGSGGCETSRGVSGFGIGEVELSTFDVLQMFVFFLQMGFTLMLATLDGLDLCLFRRCHASLIHSLVDMPSPATTYSASVCGDKQERFASLKNQNVKQHPMNVLNTTMALGDQQYLPHDPNQHKQKVL
ncbi:hypothetical protein Tco_1132355 [Tanacetum coccineum]|uniref:Uncharacterized protein n=1 Tax=Tanacetum coccineum TaxID=301880 RepID=A0ABQ5JFS5_9ASTR